MFVFSSPLHFSCSPVHKATPHSVWQPPLSFFLAPSNNQAQAVTITPRVWENLYPWPLNYIVKSFFIYPLSIFLYLVGHWLVLEKLFFEKTLLPHTSFTCFALYNYLKGGCSNMGVGVFSQVTSDRRGETASSCARGVSDSILGKDFFTREVVKLWNRLPRDWVTISGT